MNTSRIGSRMPSSVCVPMATPAMGTPGISMTPGADGEDADEQREEQRRLGEAALHASLRAEGLADDEGRAQWEHRRGQK